MLKGNKMKILSALVVLAALSGCEQSSCSKLLNDKDLPEKDRAFVEEYCDRHPNG
jgi:hypothetical protein